MSYVGYKAIDKKVLIGSLPQVLDFKLSTILLNEVQVVADIAIDRKTPVAFSTIPIKKIKAEKKINQIEIDNEKDWKKKHLNLIYENYKNAKFFNEVFFIVKKIYSYNSKKLIDFNYNTIKLLHAFYLSDEKSNWVNLNDEIVSQRLGRENDEISNLFRTKF